MRAAGVREVKNKLSEYLRLVAEGETVLVTDHGRVVAQITPPPLGTAPATSDEEALRRLAALGKVRLARGNVPSPRAGPVPGVPKGIDVEKLLDETRSDRFEG